MRYAGARRFSLHTGVSPLLCSHQWKRPSAKTLSKATVQTVVFDTDVLIWYLRGNDKARRFMELVPHQQRALSSLTFMELLQGGRNQEEARQVKAFITK